MGLEEEQARLCNVERSFLLDINEVSDAGDVDYGMLKLPPEVIPPEVIMILVHIWVQLFYLPILAVNNTILGDFVHINRLNEYFFYKLLEYI